MSGMTHCDNAKHLFNIHARRYVIAFTRHRLEKYKLRTCSEYRSAAPYLESVQTDETGYSESIDYILLLGTGFASLPPGGSLGSARRRGTRSCVFPRTPIPLGTRRGAPIPGFPGVRLPLPSPLRPGSATLLYFPFHFKPKTHTRLRRTNRFPTINKTHP